MHTYTHAHHILADLTEVRFRVRSHKAKSKNKRRRITDRHLRKCSLSLSFSVNGAYTHTYIYAHNILADLTEVGLTRIHTHALPYLCR